MNDTSFLTKNMIAHRGFHDREKGIPENSLRAYKRALENGYGIEIDLHLLKDGTVIVMHDDNTERMTGTYKRLKDCTYDDIKDLRIENTSEKIPKLEEVLELIDGKVPILIEFKYDLKAGLLEEKAMSYLEKYNGKYAVQSFNPFSLLWFKKNYPNITRGQLAYNYRGEKINYIKKILLRNLATNFITKPDFISYGISSLPNKRVEKFQKKGVIVGGWTIRNKEDYEFSSKYCEFSVGENMQEYLKEIEIKNSK